MAVMGPIFDHVLGTCEALGVTGGGYIPLEVVRAPFGLSDDDQLFRLEASEGILLFFNHLRPDYLREEMVMIVTL